MNSLPQPAVSIVVPVYNLEKYLDRCLESILNQTMESIEIICINDGSTDRSSEILEKFASEDSRIRIIAKQNEGQGVARNVGISIAKGEYVGFVDGDDWIEKEMYENMYGIAKQYDLDIQICSFKTFHTDGTPSNVLCDYNKYIGKKYNSDSIVFSSSDISEELFKISRFSWNKIYKKSFLEKNQIVFSSNRYYQDNLFFFIALLMAERMSMTKKKFYNYLLKREGSTSSKNHKPLALCEVNREIKINLVNRNVKKEFVKRFDAYNIRRCASYYYRIHKSYRKQFFKNMRAEFQEIEMKHNPFLDVQKKIFCLLVKKAPYSIFKYSNYPIYALLYLYAKIMHKPNLNL